MQGWAASRLARGSQRLLFAALLLVVVRVAPATLAPAAGALTPLVSDALLEAESFIAAPASAPPAKGAPAPAPAPAAEPSPEDDPVVVPGALTSKFLQAKSLRINGKRGRLTVHSNVALRRKASAREVSAGEMRCRTVSSKVFEANARGQLVLTGNIQVQGALRFQNTPASRRGGGATAFLETMAVVSGTHEDVLDRAGYVAQARLVAHDDFTESAAGWTQAREAGAPALRQHCGAGDNFIVAKGVLDARDQPVVEKRFTGLPPHSRLELTARVHYLGHWRGSHAFATVDSAIVWLDSHGSPNDGGAAGADAAAASQPLAFCGLSSSHTKLAQPIRVSIPHTGDSVTIGFGAAAYLIDGEPTEPLLGVDDVSLQVL
jgi:hypothetical protein